MPDFSFASSDPPIDYANAFSSRLSLIFMFSGFTDTEERFDFDKHEQYQELKQYFRSMPPIAPHVFPTDLPEACSIPQLKHFWSMLSIAIFTLQDIHALTLTAFLRLTSRWKQVCF